MSDCVEHKSNAINIIGAGGHTCVVAALIIALYGDEALGGVYDDDATKQGTSVCNRKVEHTSSLMEGMRAVIGIGNNVARKLVAARFNTMKWVVLVHPRAWVSPNVHVSQGTVIFAGAIVQPNSVIGEHAIINTRSSVDHDCHVGNFAHVAPGATICGTVVIGEGAFVGAGSTVRQNIKLCRWCTVGCGSVIVKDIVDSLTYVGVPGKLLNKH